MNDNDIMIIYGETPYEMTRELIAAAGLSQMIFAGASIGIKPNVLDDIKPTEGATTHPEIVRAIIDYLKESGHTNLLILESSWIGGNTHRAFENLGYYRIAEETKTQILDVKKDKFKVVKTGEFSMEISQTALNLDFLINVPVLKGHCQTKITGAMKNLKGIISDNEKRKFHAKGLHRPIAYLNKAICSDFVVMDGICGDLDFEEGGNPVNMNRIVCARDSVLIDSYEAQSLGYRPEEIEYIWLAESLGVGSSKIENANIIELNKDLIKVKTSASRKVTKLASYVDEKDACSACYANLISAIKRMDDIGNLSKIPGKVKICIGQGFKGKTGPGIGVGNCTLGFEKNVKGCPVNTMDIIKEIFN